MDWWHLFRSARRVVFGTSLALNLLYVDATTKSRISNTAFTAIVSLIWAALLSFYLSKEWPHFDVLQRKSFYLGETTSNLKPCPIHLGSIVLAVIGVNGFSALLLYLMYVEECSRLVERCPNDFLVAG